MYFPSIVFKESLLLCQIWNLQCMSQQCTLAEKKAIDIRGCTWHCQCQSWAVCCGWSCLSRGLDQLNSRGSIPTSAIPWFCDHTQMWVVPGSCFFTAVDRWRQSHWTRACCTSRKLFHLPCAKHARLVRFNLSLTFTLGFLLFIVPLYVQLTRLLESSRQK